MEVNNMTTSELNSAIGKQYSELRDRDWVEALAIGDKILRYTDGDRFGSPTIQIMEVKRFTPTMQVICTTSSNEFRFKRYKRSPHCTNDPIQLRSSEPYKQGGRALPFDANIIILYNTAKKRKDLLDNLGRICYRQPYDAEYLTTDEMAEIVDKITKRKEAKADGK